MISTALCTSRTEEWRTPLDLFARLDRIFGFRLDACASARNARCARFMRQAFEEARRGALVVALVPARTDTRWWHDWVSGQTDAIFSRGRLRYTDEDGHEHSSAPFPSALVGYRPDLDRLCNGAGDPAPPASG